MNFIDHDMSKAMALLDPDTGGECGKILAYYSRNPAGSVCHASVILYNKGWEVLEKCNPKVKRPENWNSEGKAGGYGYDKFSAAVSSSLHKMNLAGNHDDIKDFTFGNGNSCSEESQKIHADAIQAIKDKGIIPVYSGAGNVREAFELYFRVVEVL